MRINPIVFYTTTSVVTCHIPRFIQRGVSEAKGYMRGYDAGISNSDIGRLCESSHRQIPLAVCPEGIKPGRIEKRGL